MCRGVSGGRPRLREHRKVHRMQGWDRQGTLNVNCPLGPGRQKGLLAGGAPLGDSPTGSHHASPTDSHHASPTDSSPQAPPASAGNPWPELSIWRQLGRWCRLQELLLVDIWRYFGLSDCQATAGCGAGAGVLPCSHSAQPPSAGFAQPGGASQAQALSDRGLQTQDLVPCSD